jgi:hypothetical protein
VAADVQREGRRRDDEGCGLRRAEREIAEDWNAASLKYGKPRDHHAAPDRIAVVGKCARSVCLMTPFRRATKP